MYIISCGLMLRCSASLAQDRSVPSLEGISERAEEQYGPDPDLLNGRKYNFRYRSAEGNPFFEVYGESPSVIQIKGKRYEDQRIRFDIYRQQLILDFTDLSGATSSIVLNGEMVDHFSLGYIEFGKFPDKNGEERFGQVVYRDRISCVYFWKKNYQSELKDGQRYFNFSGPLRDAVIIRGDQVCAYKNKTSFLKCFLKEDRKDLKMQMRQQRINPRKATDQQMQVLMKYVNQIQTHEE